MLRMHASYFLTDLFDLMICLDEELFFCVASYLRDILIYVHLPRNVNHQFIHHSHLYTYHMTPVHTSLNTCLYIT
jgi:hypothetical protein